MRWCRRVCVVNHSGCSVTHGWSGEHCSARSSATSSPASWAWAVKFRNWRKVPRSGWMPSWPPSGDANRVGAAGVARLGFERVVATLAVRCADGVNRRQVHHVKTHRGDSWQALCGRCKGARRPLARALVEFRPLGARKDLVPGRRQRSLALHHQRVVGRATSRGRAVVRRARTARTSSRQRWGEARLRILVAIRERGDRVAKQLLALLWAAHLVDRASEHRDALVEHQLHVDARVDLERERRAPTYQRGPTRPQPGTCVAPRCSAGTSPRRGCCPTP